jgi:hypothetical protein
VDWLERAVVQACLFASVRTNVSAGCDVGETGDGRTRLEGTARDRLPVSHLTV